MTVATLRSYNRRNNLTSIAELNPEQDGAELDEGWSLGQPFRIARVGLVYDRSTGETRFPRPLTQDDLIDAVAVAKVHRPALDVDHAEWEPQGAVIAMALVDDGDALAILPAYNPALAAYVERCSGALWSSPVMIFQDYHHPGTGERLGGFWVRSVAITSDPATLHANLDPVSLAATRDPGVIGAAVRLTDETVDPPIPTQKATTQERLMDPEELKAMLDAILARLDGLEKAISTLQDGKAEDSEAEAEAPAEEEMKSEALSAENAALRDRVRKLEEGQRLSARDSRIGACLTAGKLTPAERKVAEKLYDKSPELFGEVYEARLSGSMIPTLKGHGHVPEASLASLDDRRSDRAKQIQSTEKVSYVAALTRAAGEV